MVMNKTEMKKLMVKTAIEVLVDKFDAYVEDTGEGRFDVEVNDFRGQLDRRNLEIGFWDSIPLSGKGWSQECLQWQKDAVALEDAINVEIKSALNQLEAQLMLA